MKNSKSQQTIDMERKTTVKLSAMTFIMVAMLLWSNFSFTKAGVFSGALLTIFLVFKKPISVTALFSVMALFWFVFAFDIGMPAQEFIADQIKYFFHLRYLNPQWIDVSLIAASISILLVLLFFRRDMRYQLAGLSLTLVMALGATSFIHYGVVNVMLGHDRSLIKDKLAQENMMPDALIDGLCQSGFVACFYGTTEQGVRTPYPVINEEVIAIREHMLANINKRGLKKGDGHTYHYEYDTIGGITSNPLSYSYVTNGQVERVLVDNNALDSDFKAASHGFNVLSSIAWFVWFYLGMIVVIWHDQRQKLRNQRSL